MEESCHFQREISVAMREIRRGERREQEAPGEAEAFSPGVLKC